MVVKFNIKNIALLSMLFFILLYLRRADQLIHPDVWNEDGIYNIPSFIKYGWYNLTIPVQGYLITVSKLITNISMSISFIHYPEISTYLTWAFTIFVALVVVYSPTILKYRVLSAISIFLVPTYAEVYGIPLYSFWIAGILILVALLWSSKKHQLFRYFILLLGGLSSPIILIAIPALIFRIIFLKYKKEDTIALIVAIITVVLQAIIIFHGKTASSVSSSVISQLLNLDLSHYIAFFFGKYYLGSFYMLDYSLWVVSDYNALLIGGIALLLLLFISLLIRKDDPYMYILIYLLFTLIFASIYRTHFDYTKLSPRYFFYISILTSWILLYIAGSIKAYRYIAIPIVILSFITAMDVLAKHSGDLEWKKHIKECAKAKGRYKIPIHFAGSKDAPWSKSFDAKTCRELIKKDLIGF